MIILTYYVLTNYAAAVDSRSQSYNSNRINFPGDWHCWRNRPRRIAAYLAVDSGHVSWRLMCRSIEGLWPCRLKSATVDWCVCVAHELAHCFRQCPVVCPLAWYYAKSSEAILLKLLLDYCYVNNSIKSYSKWSFSVLHCVSKYFRIFKLYVTLSIINWFSKFLHCWKAYEICYKTHTTLPTSL